MADRKQIALLYQYNTQWIGGTYYILNIVRALNVLEEDKKPVLTIYFSKGSILKELQEVNYPFITYVEFCIDLSLLKKVVNKIYFTVFKNELFLSRLPASFVPNFYFLTFTIDKSNIGHYYFWIADLQDLCLPHFFKPKELKKRLQTYARLVKENQPIVFSSQAALKDFNHFYPGNKNNKVVLPFISISNANIDSIDFGSLKIKFKIDHKFFIVCNQFWRHKNHLTVLKAFKIFSEIEKNIQLVLTGKENDYRDPNYTNELKKFVVDNNLSGRVLFLGFIERNEQLKLMSESIAVIQPSLFEGWSTVVEDAKFLNKPIICSDIAVHKEQLPGSNLFFKATNENDLVNKMNAFNSGQYEFPLNFNYLEATRTFANGFLELFN